MQSLDEFIAQLHGRAVSIHVVSRTPLSGLLVDITQALGEIRLLVDITQALGEIREELANDKREEERAPKKVKSPKNGSSK